MKYLVIQISACVTEFGILCDKASYAGFNVSLRVVALRIVKAAGGALYRRSGECT